MNVDDREIPSSSGEVGLETADGVATVTFGHPKGNSLPGRLLARLAGKVTEAGQDPAARVIVLRSLGDGPFCAGASFDELTAIENVEAGKEFFSGFAQVILAMIRAPKFVVARVHGKVVGGGVALVAASDFSVASSTAPAKLSELSIGIGPFVVGPCIERKIGLAAFSAMTVDTAWRDAAWCERHGLYSRVYSGLPELEGGLKELVAALASSNPEAMARLKEVFWSGTEDWDSLMDHRAEISGNLVLSEFTRNAIQRFRAR